MDKKIKRIRRAKRGRSKMRQLQVNRLTVHRSLNNIYTQLISPCGAKVLAQASSLEKDVRAKFSYCGNKEVAKFVGELIAKRVLDLGIKKVAFDRSGYKYHGRVRALAEAAREGGLEF